MINCASKSGLDPSVKQLNNAEEMFNQIVNDVLNL